MKIACFFRSLPHVIPSIGVESLRRLSAPIMHRHSFLFACIVADMIGVAVENGAFRGRKGIRAISTERGNIGGGGDLGL